MLPTTPRTSTGNLFARLALAASAAFALLAFAGAAPALAAEGGCEAQVFTQPFKLLGDSNYYTLVPGSEFDAGAGGWQLSGGAHVTDTNRPDGSEGGALEMPYDSEAESPAECVTMQYPTAAVWLRRTDGDGGMKVSVSYVGTKTELKPMRVNLLTAHANWMLEEFEVEPQLGGSGEEAHAVQFVFRTRGGANTNYDVYQVYVDPRMI